VFVLWKFFGVARLDSGSHGGVWEWDIVGAGWILWALLIFVVVEDR
jgi:hypothetical protein